MKLGILHFAEVNLTMPLKQIVKDEGLDILDNVATLADGTLSWDDAQAVIDLVVGTSFNKANRGDALKKINEIVGNSKSTRVPSSGYITKPDLSDITGFSNLSRANAKTPYQGGGGLRPRWKDSKGNIYEWDSQHGAMEVYNKNGRHIGEFDYKTGVQTKPADSTRRVEP